ncbi:uncharacterized protein LOC127806606 isoform X10 [Diospyros lotus]|uniref:uncharacterized protein LOC127806606 isoform X10 n=1 Tax=Diospyros lotus TaxID=55363 RepID=UPI002256B7E1|nr:uncharacterized protein LOC127806606 isoform X10 [Diospyros lotus]
MMQQGFPTNGTLDLPQLQAIMRTIELACSTIQTHANPAAAEATFSSLCQSPRPYQACQFILENSLVPIARFQAAAAIQDAAVREWVFLTPDEKKSLISFCLCFVMQHASSPEGYVQAKVSSVAAQLMKRGWLDFTAAEKEAFLYQVKQAVSGGHSLDVQYRGINFLESLVSEFSPSTSTAMGLPREFHEQCRDSLEQDYLKAFYCWSQDAALSVTDKIVKSDSAISEANVCAAAMRFMLQILNWDFHLNTEEAKGAKEGINVFLVDVKYEGAKRSDCILVQPGPSWRDVLITSGHIEWLLSLYAAVRHKCPSDSYWLDCPIAVSARKLIVQFCSLTGYVFPSDNGQMQERHLLQLLSGIIEWISPPDVVSKAIECGKSESEMLDGCRALLAITTVTTPLVFDKLLKSVSPIGTISLLSSLMCEVIKVLMANYSEEETWSWVARDILLDTWTSLLVPMDNTGQITILPLEGIGAAANLFVLIVECELNVASASATTYESESEYLQSSIASMQLIYPWMKG